MLFNSQKNLVNNEEENKQNNAEELSSTSFYKSLQNKYETFKCSEFDSVEYKIAPEEEI